MARKQILRWTREQKRGETNAYLSNLYGRMGLSHLGGTLRYRGVEEQARFLCSLEEKELAGVPHLYDFGENWLLMSYFNGQALNKVLPEADQPTTWQAIHGVLDCVMNIHKEGICLWDRWGGNELVDPKGRICLIDFDVSVDWPKDVPQKVKAAFDLSVLIHGCVQFSNDRQLAARAVTSHLLSRLGSEKVYDVSALAGFFDGQAAFYDKRYVSQKTIPFEDAQTHAETNAAIKVVKKAVVDLIGKKRRRPSFVADREAAVLRV